MAKKRVRSNGNGNGYTSPKPTPQQEFTEYGTITTSKGESYPVFPVSDMTLVAAANKVKMEFEAANKAITPPIIKLESAPGAAGKEIELTSLEMCEVEGDELETTARINLFEAHQKDLREYKQAVANSQLKTMCIFGLCKVPGRDQGIVPSRDDEIVKFYAEAAGIPELHSDFLYWYVSEIVLPTFDDKIKLMQMVQLANTMSGSVSGEVLTERGDAAMSMFRGKLGKQFKTDDSKGDPSEVWEAGQQAVQMAIQ